MDRTSGYLLRSFSALFFSIFLPIVAIGSLILFVRIAKITEVTQMSFSEMLLMYGYFMPTLLFYTLPITFFAALTLTMVKLSNDFETIVLFSFGISPRRLVRFFLPIATAATALLLVLSLALVPITKQLVKSFISYKSVHAVLNIQASEFGQKFGSWLVFLESKNEEDGTLHNIVLYNTAQKGEEQMLLAKNGRFFNENGLLGLTLLHGEAYRIQEDEIVQIDFETMKIYDTSHHEPFTYRNLAEYWLMALADAKRLKDLLIFVAVSLFPLLTLFYAFGFGILQPRYDKNFSYAAIFAVTTLYYAVVSTAAKNAPTLTGLFLLLFLIGGWLIFRLKIERRF